MVADVCLHISYRNGGTPADRGEYLTNERSVGVRCLVQTDDNVVDSVRYNVVEEYPKHTTEHIDLGSIPSILRHRTIRRCGCGGSVSSLLSVVDVSVAASDEHPRIEAVDDVDMIHCCPDRIGEHTFPFCFPLRSVASIREQEHGPRLLCVLVTTTRCHRCYLCFEPSLTFPRTYSRESPWRIRRLSLLQWQPSIH